MMYRPKRTGWWRVEEPTDKQVEIVDDMVRVLGIDPPIAFARGYYCDFIADHMIEYKARVAENAQVRKEREVE